MRTLLLSILGMVIFSGCSEEGEESCAPNHRTVCKEGVVYWVDSCGNQGDQAGECECGCNQDFTACKQECPCVPDCAGKVCGPDGCGGVCPPGCGPGQTCVGGACQGQCLPDCAGKCCGDDRCGGTCPDECAATGQTCNRQTCRCEGQCAPDCAGRDCGPDGCGGSCGDCNPGYDCREGVCVCPGEVCADACCAEGEICRDDKCCLPDCAGRQCGLNCAGEPCGVCARGSFCSGYQCIVSGVGDCWTGATCPAESPYCMMSCRTRQNQCCGLMPDHPRRVDGSLDDSCEVCCISPDFENPVIWPDGEPSCCATGAPYPFSDCGTKDKMCCPALTQNPRACDGSIDETCRACCNNGEYPVGVIFPDGRASCCPAAYPWPCVQNGNPACCEQPGQCG